jgi:hypothetical protein
MRSELLGGANLGAIDALDIEIFNAMSVKKSPN